MSLTLQQANRRRLRWLCLGFVLYFCLMMYGERYVRAVPYQIVLVAAVLNMAIILAFVFSIKKAYLSVRSAARLDGVAPSGSESRFPTKDERQRLTALWIGAVLCAVAFIRGLAYFIGNAGRVPFKILIPSEILSGAMLSTFLLEISKVYKKRSSGESLRR
jgi:hypothetical protein